MKTSIIRNKHLIKAVKILAVTALILAIWEISAVLKDNEFVLPRVCTTFRSLVQIVFDKSFLLIVSTTIFRVLAGLVIGIILGVLLATICHLVPLISTFVSPVLSIIKATPVASFIVLFWLSFSGTSLPILIALLMVLPIVWQNTLDAFVSIPRNMLDLTEIFNVSFKKRLKYLYFPHLFHFLAPAIITSIGLAWKSEIATEIIAYTTNSIGQQINNHKQFAETSFVFAWTIIIVLFSILLESGAKYLLKRCSK